MDGYAVMWVCGYAVMWICCTLNDYLLIRWMLPCCVTTPSVTRIATYTIIQSTPNITLNTTPFEDTLCVATL